MNRSATNNIGEIYAAIKALDIAKSLGYSRVEIRTDCNLIVEYFETICENRRKSADANKPLKWRPNDELYLKLEENCAKFSEIKFVKIKAHSTDLNNTYADKLAKRAIEKWKQTLTSKKENSADSKEKK